MSIRLRSFLSLVFLILSYHLFGQIRSQGHPVFYQPSTKSVLKAITMTRLKQPIQSQKHEEARSRLKKLQYAHKYPLAYTPSESGRWDTLQDGRRIWRLKLSSPGAYSLGIVFSRFRLPQGAQLFLYNYQSEQILGAYTSLNNKSFGKLAVEPLKGDEIIIEYVEPLGADFPGELEVGELLHDFKDVFARFKASGLKQAGSCNVNINCEEGMDWQEEKNAVCHILYSGYIASGALINNTRNDGRPFFLTAHHTLGSEKLAEEAIFFFKYEAENCEGTTGPKTNTISGSTLLATTSKLDFSLVELSMVPPSSYDPYYAGWNREDVPSMNSTCIHHPSGDVKKISKDFDAPLSASYDDGVVRFDVNTHWKIQEWDVGTTEGGSSGSPLFDQNHRIIGDLTGGDANCSSPVNDFYAKFSASWDGYPDPSQQLKYWLDPDNTGVLKLDGYQDKSGLFANFSIEGDVFCTGESIIITDQSQGDPTEYFWEFGEEGDASPVTATGQTPPAVSYSERGTKRIKLTVKSGDKTDVVVKNLLVMAPILPEFNFQLEDTKVFLQATSDDIQTIEWTFGDGYVSQELNPEHEYASSGIYFVTMKVGNVCGSLSLTREISTLYNDQFNIYPNPVASGKFLNLDLSKIVFQRAQWAIYNSKGALVDNGRFEGNVDIQRVDLSGQASGVYVLRLEVDGNVMIRKIILT